MDSERLDFASRLWLAFLLPWKVLFDGVFAGKVAKLREQPAALPEAEAEPAVTETETEADVTPALQLLAILQREGRFIDFIQEDVSGFSDAEIGAAARVVHDGCKRGLQEYIDLTPVRDEQEGQAVTLQPGFDAARNRVTGNVVGDPPYQGKLAHHGWRISRIRLPQLVEGHDPHVVLPAEIEV